MRNRFTDGWCLGDLNTAITFSANAELTDEQKRPFINAVASAASKTLTLGLKDGDTVIVTNIGGTNAFTLKNVSGDTGTSVAAGKCAIVIASTTANGSTVAVLS